MNIISRIRSVFPSRNGHGKDNGRTRARYEAATWSPNRSYLQSPVADAKKDISASTRTELLRLARYFYQNSCLTRSIVERIATYVVGSSGIQPAPKSSSQRWNERARAYWDVWSKRPDITGRMSLATYQRMIVRSVLVDGDAFTLSVVDDEGRAKLQAIEAHRIGSPTGDGNDGILTDLPGRPLAYQLLGDNRTLEDTLDASQVVHHLFVERASQLRGVTILASALTSVHDIDDILVLEKAGVKSASSITDIIKTPTGQINQEDALRNGVTADESGERPAYYERVLGTEAKVLAIGDDFAQYRSERPSSAWTGFMEFLCNTVVLSTNLPPSIVLGTKIGGADTRRDLASAQRVFECLQEQLANQFQAVWEFVIEDAAGLGSKPWDWRNVEWQYPTRVTVDAGRESEADRKDLAAGVITLEEYCNRYGVDWTSHVRQLAVEQEAVHEADETGRMAQRLYGEPPAAPPPPEGEEPGDAAEADAEGEGEADATEDTEDNAVTEDETAQATGG